MLDINLCLCRIVGDTISENSGYFLFILIWIIFFVSGNVPVKSSNTIRIISIYNLLAIISLSSYKWAVITNISLVGNHQ